MEVGDPAPWPGQGWGQGHDQWPALLNTGFFAEALLLTPERRHYNPLAGTANGPHGAMGERFAAVVRRCWEVHAMEVMEADPTGYYNLRCVLPRTWLYLDPHLVTTFQKTGPISYTNASNEHLVDAMTNSYTTWLRHQARGEVTTLLGILDDQIRTALHIPGYILGNLAAPRISVIRAETASGGSADVFLGLKPTMVLQEADAPPVVLQGFRPLWYHSAAARLSHYHWYTDELFINITVVTNVIVLNLGPVLCGGHDGSPTEPQDVIFPVPPPGIIRIPLASVPLTWTVDQAIARTMSAVRRVTIMHERHRARRLRRIVFSVLRFTRPELTTLVLSDCPFKDFMRDLVTDLNRAATETQASSSTTAPIDPEAIFAAPLAATQKRIHELELIRAVFPTVHCV
jgi:hypothetical protein